MSKPAFRKTSGAPGLLRLVRRSFSRIEDPVAGRGLNLADCLMSGLAVFGLKYASLLSFDRAKRLLADVRREHPHLWASIFRTLRGSIGLGGPIRSTVPDTATRSLGAQPGGRQGLSIWRRKRLYSNGCNSAPAARNTPWEEAKEERDLVSSIWIRCGPRYPVVLGHPDSRSAASRFTTSPDA